MARKPAKRKTYKGKRTAFLLRLPVDIAERLDDFSEYTGTTKNDFIVGILREAMPYLAGLNAAALAARRGANENAARMLSATMNTALGEMQKKVGEGQYELGLAAGQHVAGKGASSRERKKST